VLNCFSALQDGPCATVGNCLFLVGADNLHVCSSEPDQQPRGRVSDFRMNRCEKRQVLHITALPARAIIQQCKSVIAHRWCWCACPLLDPQSSNVEADFTQASLSCAAVYHNSNFDFVQFKPAIAKHFCFVAMLQLWLQCATSQVDSVMQ